MAKCRSPSVNHSSLPVLKLVATAANRRSQRFNLGDGHNAAVMIEYLFPPAAVPPRPPGEIHQLQDIPVLNEQTHDSSAGSRLQAYAAPTSEPIEQPATISISIPARWRALMTPMCDHPRAAPAPSARPILSFSLVLITILLL